MANPLIQSLLPAHAPCVHFSGACAEIMRWKPAQGHVPRGFCGATGNLEEVELVLVTAEPRSVEARNAYRTKCRFSYEVFHRMLAAFGDAVPQKYPIHHESLFSTVFVRTTATPNLANEFRVVLCASRVWPRVEIRGKHMHYNLPCSPAFSRAECSRGCAWTKGAAPSLGARYSCDFRTASVIPQVECREARIMASARR